MKTSFVLISVFIFLFINIITMEAQFPDYVKYIKPESNKTVKVEANLLKGQVVSDLSWAWNSAVACFPATQIKNKSLQGIIFFILRKFQDIR